MTDEQPANLGALNETVGPDVAATALRSFRRRMLAQMFWAIVTAIGVVLIVQATLKPDEGDLEGQIDAERALPIRARYELDEATVLITRVTLLDGHIGLRYLIVGQNIQDDGSPTYSLSPREPATIAGFTQLQDRPLSQFDPGSQTIGMSEAVLEIDHPVRRPLFLDVLRAPRVEGGQHDVVGRVELDIVQRLRDAVLDSENSPGSLTEAEISSWVERLLRRR